jgi:hypothetical protein
MGPGHDSETVILSRQQCLARLSSMGVGRIGVSMDALPVILPVQFRVVDESVLFATTRNTRLDTATTGAVIAFQADAYDPGEPAWWSVLLQGIARPVDGHEAEARGDPPVAGMWTGAGGEARLLRLGTDNMHGRSFPGVVYPFPAGPD